MHASVSSVSPNGNSVRSHVIKYKKGEKIPRSKELSIIQVTSADYRRLHQMHKNGNAAELQTIFGDMKATHSIDIQNLTLHTLNCKDVPEDYIQASIADVKTTGLKLCSCIGK